MLPIGTKVKRVNAPVGNGRIGVIASHREPTIGTYLVTFDRGMPQYWSPRYFIELEPPKPAWEV